MNVVDSSCGLEYLADAMNAGFFSKLSVVESLPFADSVILATARAYQTVLWAQDTDFKGKENVRFVAKKQL